MPSLWLLLLFGLLVLAGIVIWSIRTHRDPHLRLDCDAPIDKLVPSLSGLTLGTPVAGNSVEVLENGAFFETMLQSVGAAQKSVHFETFLWKDGTLGRRVAAALCERASAGRQVRVMLDANGSSNIGKDVLQQLRSAGCKVHMFHDHSLRNLAC